MLATASNAWGAKITVTEQITVANPTPWSPSSVYTGGDQVAYAGSVWRAMWWTQNQTPGDVNGPWEQLASAPDGTALWTPTRVFTAGQTVTYQGSVYRAKWWTRNQAPGDPYGPWTPIG